MKALKLSVSAMALLVSSHAMADYPGEQVWNASLTNNQITCGIDYPNGSPVEGGILTSGEAGTDGQKAITFNLRTNTASVAWKITEAKLVSNTGRFSFPDNLTNISAKDQTSVYVNNAEYSWSEAMQQHNVAANTATVKLAPKINLEQQYFPTGTTRIQGKIVVVCSN